MHQQWSFLNNPFLSATRKSYKKAFELAQFTDAALLARVADAFFAALYATFHPLFLTLQSAYTNWLSQGGLQEGSTFTLDQLLTQLGFGDADLGISSKINDWDLAVQMVGPSFRKKTPNYLSIFPDGHAPFQTGDKDIRIAAVQSLSTTLGTFPALAAIKTGEVDPFLSNLQQARTLQQGQISETASDSSEVHEAVVAAMTGMFALYGALVQQYAATPDAIAPLFDLEKLRSLPQAQFEQTVSPSGIALVAKRKLEPTRKMKLTALSDTDVDVFIADEKNDPVRSKFIRVAGMEDLTVQVEDLAETPDSTFIKVKNQNGSADAHVRIEILPEGE